MDTTTALTLVLAALAALFALPSAYSDIHRKTFGASVKRALKLLSQIEIQGSQIIEQVARLPFPISRASKRNLRMLGLSAQRQEQSLDELQVLLLGQYKEINWSDVPGNIRTKLAEPLREMLKVLSKDLHDEMENTFDTKRGLLRSLQAAAYVGSLPIKTIVLREIKYSADPTLRSALRSLGTNDFDFVWALETSQVGSIEYDLSKPHERHLYLASARTRLDTFAKAHSRLEKYLHEIGIDNAF